MNDVLDSVMRDVAGRWSHATPNDFGALAIAIVVSAWFFTRF